MTLTFVQTPEFISDWRRLGMSDDDLADLETELLRTPGRGPVIRGTGGLRKVRFAGRRSGRGKSGSIRVLYVHFPLYEHVYFVAAYGKSEQDDIRPNEKKRFADLIHRLQAGLERQFQRRA